LSARPANPRFLYGYERISFFSAGFEGAMIVLAAVFIIASAVSKWLAGFELQNLGWGTLLTAAAGAANGWLGWYLIRTGKRTGSLILEANGRHVLTDCWTSLGVVIGLFLVLWTGWKALDPVCAIAVALNILWSGGNLMWRSFQGLMDTADPATGELLRAKLDAICGELRVAYHGVRFRSSGARLLIEVHLLFPENATVGEAHRIATEVEERLPEALGMAAEVVTHLEALEDHHAIHSKRHYTGKPPAPED
jgi:cation diffusion facilitator family transporter